MWALLKALYASIYNKPPLSLVFSGPISAQCAELTPATSCGVGGGKEEEEEEIGEVDLLAPLESLAIRFI